jgi:hypothetical protein
MLSNFNAKVDMKMRIRSARFELLGARNACRTEQVSFEIGFEGSVSFDRFKMMREGVPNRGTSMPKTTGGKINVDTRLGDEIEGGRAKLTCWGVGM